MRLKKIVYVLLLVLAFTAGAVSSKTWLPAALFLTPSAEVVLKDGAVLHGELSQSWSGELTLILDDGVKIQLPYKEIATIAFPEWEEPMSLATPG